MSLRVIHIISNVSNINFGIWNAALFGSSFLRQQGVESIALICTPEEPLPSSFPDVPVYFLKDLSGFLDQIKVTSNDIFVSHGCWLKPSRVGSEIHNKGHHWVYVPHGMLEPWSMKLGSFKKRIYYHLFEKRYAKSASRVRAVGVSEQQNLQDLLNRKINVIGNGVPVQPRVEKDTSVIRFLFLGRLHFKKGILPLVKAWSETLASDKTKQLVIAGPDEGELEKIKPYFGENIKYLGPVYGNEKADLLRSAHYFMLPSFSEGFPVSVIEGMSYGLIPMISIGCNFNNVFDEKLGFRIEPDQQQIASVLRTINRFDRSLSERNIDYINTTFSENAIGEQLLTFYRSIPS